MIDTGQIIKITFGVNIGSSFRIILLHTLRQKSLVLLRYTFL